MDALIPHQDKFETILANSYRNFHAKGLDYICLRRSDGITRKVYFFDGDCHKLPVIVCPHDHRYDFHTQVLYGAVGNILYHEVEEHPLAHVHNRFHWNTPLNGGDGFTFDREVFLNQVRSKAYSPGDSYTCGAQHIHTLSTLTDQCILVLDQYRDVVDIGVPTRTYCPEKIPPSTDGLYDKFDADTLVERMKILAGFRGAF